MSRRWSGLPPVAWVFLAALYAAGVWVTIATRVQWGPDTTFHLAWTFRLLGASESEAVRRAVEFLADEEGITCATSTLRWCQAENYAMYFSGDFAATVGPRVMTRLLSAPFVALFGPWAMVGLSVVAYAAGLVCVVVLVSRLLGPGWGLLAGGLMVAPWLAFNWAVHANTEALAVGFTAATLLTLPLRRRASRWDVVWFAALLALGLFTRQFAVSITAGTVLAWLAVTVRDRRLGNPWAPFALAAVACTGLVVWVQGRMTAQYASGFSALETYERNTGTSGLVDVLASVPVTAGRILAGDWRHVRTDLVLAVVLAVAVVSVCWRLRSALSAFVLGMAAVTLALNLIVNSDSIFRYHTPNYPAYLLVALVLVADLVAGRQPSRGTDAAAPPQRQEERPAQADRLPLSWWLALAGLYLFVVVAVRGVDAPDAAVGNGPALDDPRPPALPGSLLPILGYGVAIALVTWLAVRRWGRRGVLAGVFMLVPTAVVPLARPVNLEPLAAVGVAVALCLLPWDREPSERQPSERGPSARQPSERGPSARVPYGWAATTRRRRGWLFAPASAPYLCAAVILLAVLLDPFAVVAVGGLALAWLTRALSGAGWRGPWAVHVLVAVPAAGLALAVRAAAGSATAPAGGSPVVADLAHLGADLMLVALLVLVLVAGAWVWRDEPAVPAAVGALLAAATLSAIVGSTGLRPVTALMPLLALAGVAALGPCLAGAGRRSSPAGDSGGGWRRLRPRSSTLPAARAGAN